MTAPRVVEGEAPVLMHSGEACGPQQRWRQEGEFSKSNIGRAGRRGKQRRQAQPQLRQVAGAPQQPQPPSATDGLKAEEPLEAEQQQGEAQETSVVEDVATEAEEEQAVATREAPPTSAPPPPPPPQEAPPQDFESVLSDKVVLGLALTLERMTALATGPQCFTSFHCREAPKVGIRQYVARMHTYFGCSVECFVVGLIFIDRLIQRHPNLKVTVLSVHRVTLCAMMLAAKVQDDVFYSNKFYAKVGGLHLQELNKLEQHMCKLLDFRLHVTFDDFERYRDMLLQAAGASPPTAAPVIETC